MPLTPASVSTDTSAKHRAKRLLVSVLDSRLSLISTSIADAIVIRACSRSRPKDQSEKSHILINSTGGGNIGDQAMFESYLANVDGPVQAIVRSSTAFAVPETLSGGRVQLIVLPKIIYGRGLGRLADVVAFSRMLRGAKSLSIVGADVMDGGYGRRPSALEWSLAAAASKAHVPTRVLGFSWKNDVDPHIQGAARRASRSGVIAIARDPHSRLRLQKNGVSTALEAADVVFLQTGASKVNTHIELVQSWTATGKRIAIVNLSGLIQKTLDQSQEYGRIVDSLRELDYEIVLLPHVSSDIPVIESFKRSHPGYEAIHHVNRLLTPSEVKALAAMAQVVVTGRMHLSILSLSSGVPSIVLATQGKVLGLMELMGTSNLCIEPVFGFGDKVRTQLLALEKDREKVVTRIQAGVKHARKLAAVNFKDL